MKWSPQQDDALRRVDDWLHAGDQQIFRLFGYAGTGKTTLAKYLAEGVDGEVQFGAFTGKAALRLKQKGCGDAKTIHSMIYKSNEAAKAKLARLEHDLDLLMVRLDKKGLDSKAIAKHPEVKRMKEQILEADLQAAKPAWYLNDEATIADASLIVVDECSMVDDRMGSDLCSFGVPILALGDPAQLPPVKGNGGFFTDHPADFMLTEVHRQAAENPILQLATKARNGERIDFGTYGENCRVIAKGELDKEHAVRTDQFIVGKNDTRHSYNRRLRQLHGKGGDLPIENDRLICLQNDHDKGLLNGSLWNVHKTEKVDENRCLITVSSLDMEDGKRVNVTAHTHHFQGRSKDLHWKERRNHAEFDYGYAITCHKSQGSEWTDVTVVDESAVFRQDRDRWLYTAITRAAERLTIAR